MKETSSFEEIDLGMGGVVMIPKTKLEVSYVSRFRWNLGVDVSFS